MSAIKLPKGLPKLPPVPAGYDTWEYMGKEWNSAGKPVGAPWGYFSPTIPDTAWGSTIRPHFDGVNIAYNHSGDRPHIVAVKNPANPKRVRHAKPTTRAQSRKSRIATAYRLAKQTDVSAWDFAAQVERIFDNSQRSKRRKAGK